MVIKAIDQNRNNIVLGIRSEFFDRLDGPNPSGFFEFFASSKEVELGMDYHVTPKDGKSYGYFTRGIVNGSPISSNAK